MNHLHAVPGVPYICKKLVDQSLQDLAKSLCNKSIRRPWSVGYKFSLEDKTHAVAHLEKSTGIKESAVVRHSRITVVIIIIPHSHV